MTSWRWSFGLFVAVPALILALLAMRAVRAERLERAQQLRDRQSQAAQLVDARMRAALTDIERQLRHPTTRRNVFTLDRSGRVVFTKDRVWFDDAPRDEIAWPGSVEELIEAARTAEVMGRADQAATSYRRLMVIEPRLRDWGRFCLNDVAPSDIANSDQITPSGVPVALFAAARLLISSAQERMTHCNFITRSLANLRAGQWWLGFEERRFYDQQLQTLLGTSGPDRRLEELAAFAQLIRNTPVRRDEPTRHFERGALIVAAPSPRDATTWDGVVLGSQELHDLMNAAVKTTGVRARIEPHNIMPGWKLAFEQNADPGWLDRQTLLWLGFIALLIVTMLTSLAGTLRIVRREADLVRMQSEFVAGVSHDFKSPLTGIRLLVERLAGGRANADAIDQYRVAAEREISRLERHVDRLLEAQQIEHGRRRYDFAPTSLKEVVDDAIGEVVFEAEAKQVRLESEHRHDPIVEVDRTAMTAAVSNLVGNAIKYSAAGARIHVRTRAEDSHAVIEVQDEGVGIGPDDLKRIFERFYRGQQQAGMNGSGLGLALVKATVDAHGGQVTATSELGRGSCFTIHLKTNDRGAQGA